MIWFHKYIHISYGKGYGNLGKPRSPVRVNLDDRQNNLGKRYLEALKGRRRNHPAPPRDDQRSVSKTRLASHVPNTESCADSHKPKESRPSRRMAKILPRQDPVDSFKQNLQKQPNEWEESIYNTSKVI